MVVLAVLGSPVLSAQESPENEFKAAIAELEDGDLESAKEKFSMFLLRFPAHKLACDALFYLAESFFYNKEYKVAAMQFNRLRTACPESPFLKPSSLRAAESYEMRFSNGPISSGDLETAIELYQNFVQSYPADPLAEVVRQRIDELRTRHSENRRGAP